jgi:hypothetical protein
MTNLKENVAGDLVLRVCGTSRDGQFLRLRSRKCTIGSGQQCTLRLSSKNLAPLHCLILRGESGTIARCWAPDTRLNGAAFSDAALNPGDRLGIGPLEFEVVALNDVSEPSASTSPSLTPSPTATVSKDEQEKEDEKRNELMEMLKAEKAGLDLRNYQINQEVVALETEKSSLERERIAFSEERNAFLASQSDFHAVQTAFKIEQNAFHADRDAFSELQRSLQEERGTFLKEQDALRAERETLINEQQAFQANRDAVLAEQKILQADREAFLNEKMSLQADRELQERVQLLNDREAALNAQAANMASVMEQSQVAAAEMARRSEDLNERKTQLDAWENRLKQAAVEAENRRTEFDLQSADLDARLEDLNTRQATLDTQLARQRDELALRVQTQADRDEEFLKEREQFASLQSDLEWRNLEVVRLREAIERERECIERERKEFEQAKLNFQQEQMNSRPEQLDSPQNMESFSEERDALLQQKADFLKEMERFQQEKAVLQQEYEILEREQELFHVEREEFLSKRQRLDEERMAAMQVAEEVAEQAPEQNPFDENASTQGHPQEAENPNKAAVDLQEILRRLGHNVDLDDDESTESQAAEHHSGEECIARSSTKGRGESASSPSQPTAAEEGDESIDAYMAQLMQRLGVNAPAPNKAQSKAAEKATINQSDQSKATSETLPELEQSFEVKQRREFVKLSPRAVAPEKNVDLSALRDLANLSAEHALGRHDFKQLMRATRSKLLVTVVALTASVVLFWHTRMHNGTKLEVIAAVLGLLIALYWGLQYAVLTGRLIVNRTGGITLRKHHGHMQPICAKEVVPCENVEISHSIEKKEPEPATSGECSSDEVAGETTA